VKRLNGLNDSIALLITASALLFALGLWFHFSTQPPDEAATIDNFYRHRAEYEELRGMFFADSDLLTVADWGVQTSDSWPQRVPPQGKVSPDRLQKYLLLLREIGAKVAFRTDRTRPEIGVNVWAAGWAGDTRHVNVCWREDEPANQVASLDEFYRTPMPRKSVYRHIEGNWYVWADW
jgi:hypothetical protein